MVAWGSVPNTLRIYFIICFYIREIIIQKIVKEFTDDFRHFYIKPYQKLKTLLLGINRQDFYSFRIIVFTND
ncbi:hypothetical protein, partial [Enterococcus gallinarum]